MSSVGGVAEPLGHGLGVIARLDCEPRIKLGDLAEACAELSLDLMASGPSARALPLSPYPP